MIAGLLLLACIVAGGGTTPGLARDHILECLVFLAGVAFLGSSALRYGRKVRLAVLFCAVAAIIPLLPVPSAFRQGLLPGPAFAAGDGGVALLTTDADRTIQSLLYCFALIILFLLFGSLRRKNLASLARFFWAGILANALTAAVEFTTLQGGNGAGPLQGAGFFANQNHFAALLYMAVPLLAVSVGQGMRAAIAIGALGLLLLEEMVAGSRAGIVFSLALAVLSFAVVPDRSGAKTGGSLRRVVLGGGGLLVVAMLVVVSGSIRHRDIEGASSRYEFARNTIEGIRKSLPLGYGYGAFPLAYPMSEPRSEVGDRFLNHAHDDYLEAVFEGGLPALLSILVYFLVLAEAALRARAPLERAALLSIAAVLLHSLVDYPLRTFAVGASFVFFNALVFHEEMPATSSVATADR